MHFDGGHLSATGAKSALLAPSRRLATAFLFVIPRQCAHCRGNLLLHRLPQSSGLKIATPVCGLVRNDAGCVCAAVRNDRKGDGIA